MDSIENEQPSDIEIRIFGQENRPDDLTKWTSEYTSATKIFQLLLSQKSKPTQLKMCDRIPICRNPTFPLLLLTP